MKTGKIFQANQKTPSENGGMKQPGYIVDIEYTENFYGQQAPALMAYVAALNGYSAPRLDREFTYCELGCGQGLTSIALAAMHPQAKVFASDFNAAHIQNARELAKAGKVGNVTLLDRSFADLLKEDLPPFDYISMHGVYSWVPESVREEIRCFIKAKLKPGGLAMLSYNAMPGWAHLQPIRRMMQAYAGSLPGNSIERARQAFAYVRHLADNKAAFFTVNPAAAEHLKSMGEADVRYLAHEYMTPHGDPFYFPEVCEAMHGIGLAYAGNMLPEHNYVELAAGPELQPLLKTAPTRIVLETHRDFISNNRFRNDLYAAQPEVPRAPPLTFEKLDGLAFSLATLPENLALKGARGPVNFDVAPAEKVVQAFHMKLHAGPATARQLHALAAGRTEADTLKLLQQLILAGHLLVCPGANAAAGWSTLSSALLERCVRANRPRVPLPAGNAATMLYFDLPFAAMMEAGPRHKDARSAAKNVLKRLRDSGVALSRKAANGTSENVADDIAAQELEAMWKKVHDPKMAEHRFLRLLGVI